MFETVYDFITTVPVASPVLRAFIMLAEIIILAVFLYWAWERVPSMVSRLSRMLSGFRARASGADALERGHLADLSNN